MNNPEKQAGAIKNEQSRETAQKRFYPVHLTMDENKTHNRQ
jgi:hypothetical protein